MADLDLVCMMSEDKPVLYVLMRTDMASMNPGKGMAQASHAYGAVKHHVLKNIALQQVYRDWMSQTRQEFGTTIVFGGSEGEIQAAMNWLNRYVEPAKQLTGWVHDPTYPITDGDVVHLVPINTCVYMFGMKKDIENAVRELEMHP